MLLGRPRFGSLLQAVLPLLSGDPGRINRHLDFVTDVPGGEDAAADLPGEYPHGDVVAWGDLDFEPVKLEESVHHPAWKTKDIKELKSDWPSGESSSTG